ncbi:MAG: Unknown protein [uncultured Sulfurovum sp.]|uniref:Lipoprotein n=1 Tax=uncultured Sulfurovum sp. TaxID=269237 RepID=A0A6S6TFH2_9BACT|nr:MAG: Unknown protein [uncultured Sulfurovum sp.]
MKIKILTLLIILNLLGCGNTTSSENSTDVKLPNIGMDIPKVLIPNNDELRAIFTESEKQTSSINTYKQSELESIPHFEAKAMTYNTLVPFEHYQNTIIGLNTIFPKIQDSCKETNRDETCYIAPNSLKIEFTPALIDTLIENEEYYTSCIVDKKTVEDTNIFLGEIEFIHYSENSEYAYLLRVNYSEVERVMCSGKEKGEEVTLIREIKFNKEGTNFFTSASKEYPDGYLDLFSLHYIKNSNNKEILRASQQILNDPDDFSEYNTIAVFEKNNDQNETFHITSYLLNSQVTATSNYYDTGKYALILDNLNASQTRQDKEEFNNSLAYFNQDTVFDKEGSRIAVRSCTNNEDCILEDTSTWEITTDREDPFNNFNVGYSRELNLTKDDKLKNGEYFLLASEHNTSNLTISDVFNNKVAEVIILQNAKQAHLYNKAYENKLNELQWVYANYNQNLDGLTKNKDPKSFTLVQREDVPTIRLF